MDKIDKLVFNASNKAQDAINRVTVSEQQINDLAYNVKSFGAKGDGIVYDDDAIMNCINACNSGIVYIPAGTYILSKGLRDFGDNLVLRGAGNATVLKRKSQFITTLSADTIVGETHIHVVSVEGATVGERIEVTGTIAAAEAFIIESIDTTNNIINLATAVLRVHVSGTKVFSNWCTVDPYGDGLTVHISSCSVKNHFRLENIKIDGNKDNWTEASIMCGAGYEVDLHLLNYATLENVTIENGRRLHARIMGGLECLINECIFKNGASGAVMLESTVATTLSNNRIYGFTSAAAIQTELAHKFMISGNTIIGCQHGIYTESSGAIVGNNIAECTQYGINIYYKPALCIGNYLYNNGLCGIRMKSLSAGQVSHNICRNDLYGIWVQTCTGVAVKDNTLVDSDTYKIRIDADCSNIELNGNVEFGIGTVSDVGVNTIKVYHEGRMSAAPIAGTWAVGQRIENSTPSAGGYAGWICVTAGTPGTWKGFGLIEV